jgi:polar amino acid transport system substrate-binding protein
MSQAIDSAWFWCSSTFMEKRKKALLLFSCIWYGLSAWASAESELEPGLEAGPVKFVTTMIEPWGYMNSDGSPDGLLPRFAELLGQETGIPYTNQLQPYPRVKHSLKHGQADMAVMFVGPQSDTIGESLGAVVNTKIMIVAAQGAEPVQQLNELIGRRVGYIRGSRYGEAFDNHPDLQRIPINTMFQGIAMLLTGRLDAMASTEQSLSYTLQKMSVEKERVVPLIMLGETCGDLYISYQSVHGEHKEVYRQALRRLHENGSLENLFYQHGRWQIEWSPAD